MTPNALKLIQGSAPDGAENGGTIRMSVVAADAIAARLDSQEQTIVAQAKQISRLKGQVEMLDKANELLAGERDKAQRRADLWQGAAQAYSRKLAEHYQRTPEQNESLADQIESHRSNQ